MNSETNRLNTFTNWPASAPVDSIRLAKAGFYYTGEGTEVQCFSCGGKISNWNYGDQVMYRHRTLEPNCQFVVNSVLSGNVPLVLGSQCPSSTGAVTSMSFDMEDELIRRSQPIPLNEEDEMYRSDALRLLSFANWEDNSVSRESLVAAGFYHKGEGRVRCAWCGGEIAPFRAFGSMGTPLGVHRMYFSWCPRVAAMESWHDNSVSSRTPVVNDFAPNWPPPEQPTQPQSSGAAHNERLLNMSGTWRSLGVVSGGARHPNYASLAARLASFERWPADRQQVPQTLAEAGFFHTGIDDQVRCFYCDGGLGKWEAGDTPWSEHARWFPHCGYVLLHKGQEFVDSCRTQSSVQRTLSAESGLSSRRRNPGVNFPITESQVEECMESGIALAALGAGLDAARVRRALSRRLRATGLPFTSSEALIDAVLDEQLNEEAWSVSPQSQRLARDILAETLRDFAPRSGIIRPAQWETRPDSASSNSESPSRSLTPQNQSRPTESNLYESKPQQNKDKKEERKDNQEEKKDNQVEKESASSEKKTMSLEEENRQLKEARLCKVCMDSEVSVVFLPCGHLVSCGDCGSALPACPLCRCEVKALVRAYLA